GAESVRIHPSWSEEEGGYTGTVIAPAVQTAMSMRTHSSRVSAMRATRSPGSTPAPMRPRAILSTRRRNSSIVTGSHRSSRKCSKGTARGSSAARRRVTAGTRSARVNGRRAGAAVSRIRRYDLSGTTTMSVTDYRPQGHGAASRAGFLGGPAGPTGLYQLHYIVDRSVHSRERNFLWP